MKRFKNLILPLILIGTLSIGVSSCQYLRFIKFVRIAGLEASEIALGELLESVLDNIFSGGTPKNYSQENPLGVIPYVPNGQSGYINYPLEIQIGGQRTNLVETSFKISPSHLKFVRSRIGAPWQFTKASEQLIGERMAVASAQLSLFDLGFNPGRIDGIIGPNTNAAVVSFQRSRSDVFNSGKLDPSTLNALLTF